MSSRAFLYYSPVSVRLAYDRERQPIVMYLDTPENEGLITRWLEAIRPEVEPSRYRKFIAKAPESGRCDYCLRQTDRLERDHIVPFAAGGDESYSNIAYACRSCNAQKRDRSLFEFLAGGATEVSVAVRRVS